MKIETSASARIKASQEKVWEYVSDLTNVSRHMKGWGPIPGVKKVEITSEHTEMTVGLTQITTTTNGDLLHEAVTKVQNHEYFEYEITGFGPPFGYLIKSGGGFWKLKERGDTTEATWGYNFTARSPLTFPLSFLIVKSAFRKTLQDAVANARDNIEKEDKPLL